jgi:hypothetical protein
VEPRRTARWQIRRNLSGEPMNCRSGAEVVSLGCDTVSSNREAAVSRRCYHHQLASVIVRPMEQHAIARILARRVRTGISRPDERDLGVWSGRQVRLRARRQLGFVYKV